MPAGVAASQARRGRWCPCLAVVPPFAALPTAAVHVATHLSCAPRCSRRTRGVERCVSSSWRGRLHRQPRGAGLLGRGHAVTCGRFPSCRTVRSDLLTDKQALGWWWTQPACCAVTWMASTTAALSPVLGVRRGRRVPALAALRPRGKPQPWWRFLGTKNEAGAHLLRLARETGGLWDIWAQGGRALMAVSVPRPSRAPGLKRPRPG
jgi:hypothetical protein